MSDALPRAVFFDWDGTLADSYNCIEGAHDHALAQLGLPPRPAGWFRHFFGKPRDYIYDTIYEDQRQVAQSLFERYLQQSHTKLIQPLMGADGVLSFLRDSGVILGVVTNKRGDFVADEIAAFGWTPYFDAVVGAGEAPEDKPSPQPLYLALERSGYDGEIGDVLFVGDTHADLECARRASCPVAFVMGDSTDPAMLDSYDVLLSFSEYDHFLSFLREKKSFS